MHIGERLQTLREEKNLSQGDIENRTGLLRCYISRVENGHTVPAIETLEKMARALDMQLYQLLYDGDEPPRATKDGEGQWGSTGKDGRYFNKLRRLLAKASERDRNLLLGFAQRRVSSRHSAR